MPMTKLERKLIYPLSIYSQNDFDHAVPVEEQHAVSQDAITLAKRRLVVYRFIVSLDRAGRLLWLARIGRD